MHEPPSADLLTHRPRALSHRMFPGHSGLVWHCTHLLVMGLHVRGGGGVTLLVNVAALAQTSAHLARAVTCDVAELGAAVAVL